MDKVLKVSNVNFLSSISPIIATTFPIVKAASIVPIPRPSICPIKKNVIHPVTKRHITSKLILMRE